MFKWYVVKIKTNNGIRIGMLQEGVAEPVKNDIILERDLEEKEAEKKVKEHSKQLDIPEFDNNTDIELE